MPLDECTQHNTAHAARIALTNLKDGALGARNGVSREESVDIREHGSVSKVADAPVDDGREEELAAHVLHQIRVLDRRG